MTLARIHHLKEQTAHAGLDAVSVIPGPNMIYLTGLSFHLSERPIAAFFPVEGTAMMVVPELEETKAHSALFDFQIFTYDDENGSEHAFHQVLSELGLSGKRLGVEGRRIRFLELELLRSNSGPKIVNADATFAELRMRKDENEIANMRRAIAIAEHALAITKSFVRPGMTEKEIAAELTLQLLSAGSEAEIPFAPIVASGANGANPHAVATDYSMQPGDLITLDWGARYEHYVSDITRTYRVGGAPGHPDLVHAYEAVLAANQAGRAAAYPGATGQDVDRAARKVIEEAGLSGYFVHRTGHGLGLEAHEEPYIQEGGLMLLEPGMTFSVEPGVYIPRVGGVRVEDDVLVTSTGAESMTTLPRELTTITS